MKVVVLYVHAWTWTFRFSWSWSCVVGSLVPYVSKDHNATIFRVRQFKTIYLGWLDCWRWSHSDPTFETLETTNPNLITQVTSQRPESSQPCCQNLKFYVCEHVFWSDCDMFYNFMILWLVTLHSWVCCYRPADGWCAGSSWCVG